MTDLSRRHLIQGAVAAGAALAGSTVAVASPKQKWDEVVDVIVIGSGFAGLAAAIEAKKAGANVVVLEKMATFGGNSIINGGILTATGCPQQKLHKIEDSVELLEKDILTAGNYMNYSSKVRYLAEHALSNYEWTVKELGVQYLPDAIGQEGGHSVPRYVTTTNGSGSGIVTKELDKCKELGIPLRNRVFVEHIIRGDNGVEGVQVREGYRFPKADSGKVKTIRATKGVVLCYGGFSADVKFRMFQDPKLNETLDTTNQPGATSEMWRETSAIGALQVQNDWIQCGPWGCPREKGMGIGWQFNQTAAAEYGLWVNAEGKRFVNELANRKVRADAIMVEQANGKKCFAICNEPNVQPLKKQRPGFLEKMLERKIVEKYDSLEALAKAAGINVDKMRLISVIMSTWLGAVGILMYEQGFGFVQLYMGPFWMALPAVSAILIGGASVNKASIPNVIIGTFLFQGIVTMTPTVMNSAFHMDMSEVIRIIVSNGMILYALTRKTEGGR